MERRGGVQPVLGLVSGYAKGRTDTRSIAKRRADDSARYTIAYTRNEVKVYLGDDMIREVKWFGPTQSNDADTGAEGQDKVFVGVMACSPKDGGADVTWRDFTLKQGVRAH